MDQQKVCLAILGMSIATYLPRLIPAWFLASRQLPHMVVVWLRYVPPAVMAAMLVPWVVVSKGKLDISMNNMFLLAAIPTVWLAYATRNFFGTILAGACFVAVGRYFFGFV